MYLGLTDNVKDTKSGEFSTILVSKRASILTDVTGGCTHQNTTYYSYYFRIVFITKQTLISTNTGSI